MARERARAFVRAPALRLAADGEGLTPEAFKQQLRGIVGDDTRDRWTFKYDR